MNVVKENNYICISFFFFKTEKRLYKLVVMEQKKWSLHRVKMEKGILKDTI